MGSSHLALPCDRGSNSRELMQLPAATLQGSALLSHPGSQQSASQSNDPNEMPGWQSRQVSSWCLLVPDESKSGLPALNQGVDGRG